jgi:hypothetical protein
MISLHKIHFIFSTKEIGFNASTALVILAGLTVAPFATA